MSQHIAFEVSSTLILCHARKYFGFKTESRTFSDCCYYPEAGRCKNITNHVESHIFCVLLRVSYFLCTAASLVLIPPFVFVFTLRENTSCQQSYRLLC